MKILLAKLDILPAPLLLQTKVINSDFVKVAAVLSATYGIGQKLSMIRGNTPAISFLTGCLISSVVPMYMFPLVKESTMTFAWKTLLTASLVISILGSTNSTSASTPDKMKQVINISKPVVIAFIIGVIGSVIGGILSYYFLSSYFGNSEIVPAAATLISCLTASYVGGSANFFVSSLE